MRRSDRPTGKQAERENEAQGKLKGKSSRSDNGVSKSVTLDNDTMVEVIKHLNYCQLAKSSLVSKRYRGLIQKNRHKMARLTFSYIGTSLNKNLPEMRYSFPIVKLTPQVESRPLVVIIEGQSPSLKCSICST
ncbi:hypothetical protein DdX_17529 [Ditylenchus destructor]|uniref:F-box domain-containing protein n=1 Tax=Ditylenchus destructor TaxID=166010 RepID=A0AAD4QYX6_9BILA|nr:hypothetical protein DdX_17529 [Ditylenchus destructor]